MNGSRKEDEVHGPTLSSSKKDYRLRLVGLRKDH